MNHLITQAQQRWQQLSAREQRLLLLMALVLGSALFYLVLWQPAHQQSARLAANVASLRAEARLVSTLASEARALKPQAEVAPLAAAELQVMLGQTLRDAGLAGLQLQAEGEFGVRVQGEATFDDWVRACGQLAGQQVRVLRMQTSATTPGRVKLDAVLVHAGGEA
jgi:general secretion pathway protein M